MGLLRRSVYNQKDTIVTLRPWVDTTYLDNGVEKAYIKQCKLHYSFTSNKPSSYVRIYRRQFINNSMWTVWMEASGGSGSFFPNVEYERVIATAIDISNQSPITQFKVSFEFNSEEVFSQVVTVCIDYDGNVYNMTKIGNQWWTCENMRATHYADGTALTDGGNNRDWYNQWYYEYKMDEVNMFEKAPLIGRLYNWAAATKSSDGSSDVNIQGIAPTGFHIPSNNEFYILKETIANGDSAYSARMGDDRYYKQFPSAGLDYNENYKWDNNSTVIESIADYNVLDRNSSMFSAVSSGSFFIDEFDRFNMVSHFWSSTPYSGLLSYDWYLNASVKIFTQHNYQNHAGLSVRCICNHNLDTI